MNDDLRKSEDERAQEQKMISKHSSTNWVRTRDKCGIAVLGMKSLGGSGEMVRHGGITAEQGFAVCHEFVGRNHDLRHGLDGSVASESCRRGDFSTLLRCGMKGSTEPMPTVRRRWPL